MKLRRFLALLLAALLPLATRAAEEESDRAKTQVLNAERHLTEALESGDAAALESLLSRAWRMVQSDGVVLTRAQLLAALKGEKLKFTGIKLSQLEVRVFGQMAVVIGISDTTGSYEGEAFESRDRFTDVFILVEGAWKCATSHSSYLLEEGGAE